jgi:acyl-CoA thioesterase-1
MRWKAKPLCNRRPAIYHWDMRSRWTIAWVTLRLTTFMALLLWAAPAGAAKIGCVGDSITYGYGLSNPSQQSYPAVLQTLLGAQHTVKNFGTSGCTLMKKGDKPYWNDANFSASDAFKPDVVVIMLGTNDAKPENWSKKADFLGDYASLIDHYRGLGARVYVATPPPVYPPGAYGIDPTMFANEVVPLVRQAATGANAPIIEVFTALSGNASYFPDYVHPNAAGAQRIAQTVATALQDGWGTADAGAGGVSGSGGSIRDAGGSSAATGGTPGAGGASNGAGGGSGAGGAAGSNGGSGSGGGVATGGATQGVGGVTGAGGTRLGTGGNEPMGGTLTATGGSLARGGALGAGGARATGGDVASAGGRSGGAGGQTTTTSSGLGGGPNTHGGAAGSPQESPSTQGCSCRVGQAKQDGRSTSPWLAMLLFALVARRLRARR